MSHKKVMKLATEGKRLGAYCIDLVIPFIGTCILLAAAVRLSYYSPLAFNNGFGYGYGYGYNYGFNRTSPAGVIAAFTIASLMLLVYMIVQIVFFTKAKTMGKAALGLQVVSSDTGEPVGFWKMLFREWFVKKASSHVFLIGYIWVIVDDKNRGWHDKILDTYVVDLRESAALNASRAASAAQAQAQAANMQRPAPAQVPQPTAQVSAPQKAQALQPEAPAPKPVQASVNAAAQASAPKPEAARQPEKEPDTAPAPIQDSADDPEETPEIMIPGVAEKAVVEAADAEEDPE